MVVIAGPIAVTGWPAHTSPPFRDSEARREHSPLLRLPPRIRHERREPLLWHIREEFVHYGSASSTLVRFVPRRGEVRLNSARRQPRAPSFTASLLRGKRIS
jgi:hypothetical protein